MIDGVRCEVLNASYEPLNIVPVKVALRLVVKGKASVLTEHPTSVINTSNDIFCVPTRILMNYMVKGRPTTRVPAQLTQRNLFTRDKWTCQYCLRHRSELNPGEFLTRDHIHPQDKGGEDTWTNLVTACNKCNNIKANLTLQELAASGRQMVPAKEPYVPTIFELWAKAHTRNKPAP